MTQLEEAVSQPDSRAFFLAATLLETLVEWRHDHGPCVPSASLPGPPSPPVQLSLQDTVPLTPFQAAVTDCLT